MPPPNPQRSAALSNYLFRLRQAGFSGDIEDSYDARIVAATDNSVYQVLPQAILYPRCGKDINRVVQVLAQQPGDGLAIVARGGGTGTNGQSLGDSLILDTSRYLNRILALDPDAKRVTVEPGVILDQLNAALAEYGLFFPPDVSSGSRATIGGMVATDASGKGSRRYGKTSDWIESMEVVPADGSDFHVAPQSFDHSRPPSATDSFGERAARAVYELVSAHRQTIDHTFPAINRGLTGYNLKQLLGADGQVRLSYLLAGSEGTLALTKSVTLRVTARPRQRALMVVSYDSFDHTLAHVAPLLQAEPVAIEVLDDHILQAAKQDSVWQDVEASLQTIDLQTPIRGLSFIEINAINATALQQRCAAVSDVIAATGDGFGVISHLLATDPAAISGLWAIRRRAVGLLGAMNLGRERRPIAFVEDTAVPPDRLPAYIQAFRKLLQSHGLQYGMYGHADVGCLHVRPALDMRQLPDRQLLRSISDEVAALVLRFGGVFWGEHGRGFRGEYAPRFFGPELTPLLGEIKALFDPDNRFNPGKLAAPATQQNATVKRIDEVPLRGTFDAQISPTPSKAYHSALVCNGNAVCQNQSVSDAMCPSYKATQDKRHSPKGRAAMLREWLRLSESRRQHPSLEPLEAALYASLHSCLSCQSCTHSCPVKVDIPELKSRFLQQYHQRHRRPAGDYLFAGFERFAAMGRKLPAVTNRLLHHPVTTTLLARAGLTALPRFSGKWEKMLNPATVSFISRHNPPADPPEKSVILLPDSFNASFDGGVLTAACRVINALGYHVLLPPVLANGKALHVKGFRHRFRKTAQRQQALLRRLADSGRPILSLEIATRVLHQKEYPAMTDQASGYQVRPIESWLREVMINNKAINTRGNKIKFQLFPHCMEQTADKHSSSDWAEILASCGIEISIEVAGCCGMSGLFGHERSNADLAEKIFLRNWSPRLEGKGETLATGFSCRCQLRNHGKQVRHPIQLLADRLTAADAAGTP